MILEKDLVVSSGTENYTSTIYAGNHLLTADEPVSLGGKNKGPTPFEYLLSALGACTTITLKMYANRKHWDLKKITVSLNMEKTKEKGNETTKIKRLIALTGNLSEEQKKRLINIALVCPVHKLLNSKIEISTILIDF